jgi:hypothetical protein
MAQKQPAKPTLGKAIAYLETIFKTQQLPWKSKKDVDTFTASVDAVADWCDDEGVSALATPLDEWKELILSIRRDGVVVSIDDQKKAFNLARGAMRRIKTLTKNPPKKIPPENRTRPMTKQEAARLLGLTVIDEETGRARRRIKDAVELLTKQMNDGIYRFEKHNRQRFVFDRRDFPIESHPKVTPK